MDVDNYRITHVYFNRFFIYLQGTEELWPYLLLLNIVPALASVCILPLLPESPRYLMLTCNKLLEAKKGTAHRGIIEYTGDLPVSTVSQRLFLIYISIL